MKSTHCFYYITLQAHTASASTVSWYNVLLMNTGASAASFSFPFEVVSNLHKSQRKEKREGKEVQLVFILKERKQVEEEDEAERIT